MKKRKRKIGLQRLRHINIFLAGDKSKTKCTYPPLWGIECKNDEMRVLLILSVLFPKVCGYYFPSNPIVFGKRIGQCLFDVYTSDLGHAPGEKRGNHDEHHRMRDDYSCTANDE